MSIDKLLIRMGFTETFGEIQWHPDEEIKSIEFTQELMPFFLEPWPRSREHLGLCRRTLDARIVLARREMVGGMPAVITRTLVHCTTTTNPETDPRIETSWQQVDERAEVRRVESHRLGS